MSERKRFFIAFSAKDEQDVGVTVGQGKHIRSGMSKQFRESPFSSNFDSIISFEN
ncbi:MAG: hypothetical protein LBE57_01035 [Methanosarcinales archaeon]|nr:hypothetical protein [Methanosarcinales archaeon]